jgi:hypothetical protein
VVEVLAALLLATAATHSSAGCEAVSPGSGAPEAQGASDLPDFKLKVHLAGVPGSATLSKIKAELDNYASVQTLSDERSCHLMLREEDGRIVTEAADKTPRSPPVPESDPDAVGRVVKQVLQWSKWYAVQSLANPGSKLAVRAQFWPAPATPGPPGAPREVFSGQQLEMVIDNASDSAVNVAVIYLSSDGSIDVVFPPEGGAQQIAARSRSGAIKLQFFVPEGQSSVEDTVKVFATTGPIDVGIFRRGAVRGAQSTAATDPLMALLESSMLGSTRGLRPVPVESWTTTESVFVVRKGQ